MARSSRFNGINLGVDMRRFRPRTVALAIVIAAIVGLAVSAVNNDGRDGGLVRQAVITPTPTDGVGVELNVAWEDLRPGGYLNSNFGITTNGLTISDITGSTPAGEARLRTDTDIDGIPSRYDIDLPWVDGGVTQGQIQYRIDSDADRFTATVAGNWMDTPYIVDIVGAELSGITCEVTRNDHVAPCSVTNERPGVYQAKVTNARYGEDIVISADLGAAVADASVEMIQPPKYRLPNNLQTPLMGALFVAFAAAWIWWAVRRGSNEYRDQAGNIQTLTDRQLIGLAAPTLDLPTDIEPVMARALANERISRMIVVTYIADLMRQRILAGALSSAAPPATRGRKPPLPAVMISRGPNAPLASEFDQIAVNAMLENNDPQPIGVGPSGRFVRSTTKINDALAERVGELDWWRRGNPSGRRVFGISMWWSIPWFFAEMMLIPAAIGTRGLINLAVMVTMGMLFVVPVCYLLVIRRLLPSLSAAGSTRLIEIESLRLGLENVSEEQVIEMARNGALSDYAAWSVALNVPRLDYLVTQLTGKYPHDPALAAAQPITRCVRNITRAGVGISIVEAWGWIVRWDYNGAGRWT